VSEKIDGDNQVNQVKPASKKRMLISLGVISGGLVIVFGGLFGFKYMVDKKGEAIMSKWVMAPATVTATKAKTIDWNPYIESVGETQSINGVNVTAQVAGVVTKIDFKSGQMVKKGDKIFEIQHDTQNAQLEQDRAAMAIAEITYLRDQKLYEGNAASAQTRDTSLAEYQEAKATVANDQAEVDYHIIKAPFSGKLGIRQINLGEYFDAGGTAVTLNQIKPIYVNFNIVESDLGQLSEGQTIQLKSTAFPDKDFIGKITSLNSTLSSDTRALEVQATLSNDDDKNLLLPGMFTTIHLMLPKQVKVITVPTSAVNYTLYGDTIYVLSPQQKDGKPVMAEYSSFKDGEMKMLNTHKQKYIAIETPVKMGLSKGLETAVLTGIKDGNMVATSGQLKLHNGAITIIDDNIKLNNPNMSVEGLSTNKNSK